MIKDLIKVANRLDSLGLAKEADYLDAIIKKLASEPDPEVSKALKRESDLFFESADPRWVNTNMPMEKVDNDFNRRYHPENFKSLPSSLPAEPDPLQSVSSYLDVERLEDLKDRKAFFLFLADKIDRADQLAKPFEDISFIGPPKIITRENKTADFLRDPSVKRLHDKYGQPIIDALWKYIDEAAEIISNFQDSDPNKRWLANEDLRALNNKITRLRN